MEAVLLGTASFFAWYFSKILLYYFRTADWYVPTNRVKLLCYWFRMGCVNLTGEILILIEILQLTDN